MPPSAGFRRASRTMLWAFVLAALTAPACPASERERKLPEPLVYLRDVDASILQDMRYAGPDNFTGKRVPGYLAAECVLLREVAEACRACSRRFCAQALAQGLRRYDACGPRLRGLGAARELDPSLKRFHPNLERRRLISLGYIAAVSRHSRGDAVDLTLVSLPAPQVPAFSRDQAYGACTGPAKARSPDNGVDMGTGFDCLDPLSHTNASGITPAQRRWRRTLVEAMKKQGFRNYHREWWHFEFTPERPGPAFSVPIPPRRP
jgi:D-alanyl-D-alanine dipeptidase